MSYNHQPSFYQPRGRYVQRPSIKLISMFWTYTKRKGDPYRVIFSTTPILEITIAGGYNPDDDRISQKSKYTFIYIYIWITLEFGMDVIYISMFIFTWWINVWVIWRRHNHASNCVESAFMKFGVTDSLLNRYHCLKLSFIKTHILLSYFTYFLPRVDWTTVKHVTSEQHRKIKPQPFPGTFTQSLLCLQVINGAVFRWDLG